MSCSQSRTHLGTFFKGTLIYPTLRPAVVITSLSVFLDVHIILKSRHETHKGVKVYFVTVTIISHGDLGRTVTVLSVVL